MNSLSSWVRLSEFIKNPETMKKIMNLLGAQVRLSEFIKT